MKCIGLIGKGFVGHSVFEGMRHAFRVIAYDKITGCWDSEAKRDGNVAEFAVGDRGFTIGQVKDNPEMHLKWVIAESDGPLFVCVPTPMNPDGSCNTEIVKHILNQINQICKANDRSRVVVIKSTVKPGTTDELNDNFKYIHVCYNPEFLRETTAIEDFKNQDRIIVGGPRDGTNVLKQMYEIAYPDVPVTKTSSTIAELVKYTTNCFLATKVAFANEIASLCEALGEDYDKVVEYATKDKRLGNSHWAVPGPDGKKGFGGSCFPKDLNALMKLFEEMDLECSTMKGAWETNLRVRPEKDWCELKGRAVT